MRRVLFAAAFLSLFSLNEGFPQSPSAVPAPEKNVPAAADVPAAVKKEEPKAPAVVPTPAPEQKKAEPKTVSTPASRKEPVKEAASPAPAKPADNISLSLSEYNDGDFRSMRIPGFVPDKKNLAEAVVPSAPAKADAPDPGKSKRRATLLGWATLIVLIVVIVALYRYSRKKRHRKVFRSIR
jgi:pyruvate/2-oxoglutarate dehydrogenase complex dihydrolipoamide acyltransferase (E2) component